MTDTRFVVDQEEFDKAGLAEQGYYLWRVESVRAADKKYGDGESFPIISMRLTGTHTVETDDEGNVTGEIELDNPISRPFEEFKISGRAVRKLRTLYQAITGRPLVGTGDGTVDLLAAAEELIGGSAWNNVFHASYQREDGTTGWKDMMTNTFKSKAPKKIRVEEED